MSTFCRFVAFGLIVLSALGIAALAQAAPVIHYGTVFDDSGPTFSAFLSQANATTRTANFNYASNVTYNGVTIDGTAGSGSGSLANGISWTGLNATSTIFNYLVGDGQDAARNAMANTGIHASPTITVTATPGRPYVVEMLLAEGFSATRNFDVTANGTLVADNLSNTMGNTKVYRFPVAANAGGITLNLTPGGDGVDSNPYVNALSVTERAWAPTTRTYENADHSMAAGDFGIAFLDGGGNIRTYQGGLSGTPVQISGASATRVVAADIDGNSLDEIAYVNSATSAGLWTYDFTSTTNRGGGAISDISGADFNNNGKAVVNVVNTSGQMFFWTAASGYGGQVNNAGSLAHGVHFGELDSAHAGSEFVGVYQPWNQGAGNNARIISHNGSALTFTGIGGGGINEIASGNFFNNGGNEVLLTNATGWVYAWEPSAFTQIHAGTSGVAVQLTAGDLDGNGIVEAYWINSNDRKVYRYLWGAGESLLTAAFNDNWSKIMAADLNGDGRDELYGLKLGDYDRVWWFEAGSDAFLATPEPASVILWAIGLAAVGLWLRRRRLASR